MDTFECIKTKLDVREFSAEDVPVEGQRCLRLFVIPMQDKIVSLQFTANDSEQGGNYILHTYSTACRSQSTTSLCYDNEDI
jgi:hypothetical protein